VTGDTAVEPVTKKRTSQKQAVPSVKGGKYRESDWVK